MRKRDDLLSKVYHIQKLWPAPKDWSIQVENDKKEYEINLQDDDIANMSKSKFKDLVEKSVNKKAFEELIESNKSKVENLIKTNVFRMNKSMKIQMQQYLTTNELTTDSKKILFKMLRI